jgi:hypothetical protein
MQLMNSIRNFHAMIRHLTIFFLLSNAIFASVSTKVIQNNAAQLLIQVDINATSEADIQPITFIVGFPTDELPVTRIQFLNKSELSFTHLHDSKSDFDWINQQRLKNLETGTIRVSPRDDSKLGNSKILDDKGKKNIRKNCNSYRWSMDPVFPE